MGDNFFCQDGLSTPFKIWGTINNNRPEIVDCSSVYNMEVLQKATPTAARRTPKQQSRANLFSGHSQRWQCFGFVGFLGSKRLGFTTSMMHITQMNFIFSRRHGPHTQDLQDFMNRIGGTVRCPSFQNIPKLWLSNISTFYGNNMSENDLGFSRIVWRILGSARINNMGFMAQGHDRKSRNHRTDEIELLQ